MINNHSHTSIGSPDVHPLRVFGPVPALAHEPAAPRPASNLRPTLPTYGPWLHHRPEAPPDNRLWACLTPEHRGRMLPRSELVQLKPGMQLMRAEQTCTHVYFPCSATVSLILTTQAGKSCQVGMVGNEGMVGIHGVVGTQRMPYEAVVRTAGSARRIHVQTILNECGRGSDGADLFLRYSQALTAQIAYSVVCCQHHSVEQRISRLLLQAFDAVGDELLLTHELLSECVGVRRETITVVAHRLHRDGIISYTRGRIVMCNRAALRQRSCECYAAVKRELESVFVDERYGSSQRRRAHPN